MSSLRGQGPGTEAAPPKLIDLTYVHGDADEARRVATPVVGNYYMTCVEHYEFGGKHFESTSGYASYAAAKEAIDTMGLKTVVDIYVNAQIWGTPEEMIEKHKQRKAIVGEYEPIMVFQYGGLTGNQAQEGLSFSPLKCCLNFANSEIGHQQCQVVKLPERRNSSLTLFPNQMQPSTTTARSRTRSARTFVLPADARTEEVDVGGIRALWVSAPEVSSTTVAVVVHGGGFTMGSAHWYREFGYRISQSGNCRSLVVDYRLAPEHPFPSPSMTW